MSEYILTEEAERDLDEIWEYIAAESITSADSVVREIREGIELTQLDRFCAGFAGPQRACLLRYRSSP
jgi:plasmid stabilization system protein ParE